MPITRRGQQLPTLHGPTWPSSLRKTRGCTPPNLKTTNTNWRAIYTIESIVWPGWLHGRHPPVDKKFQTVSRPTRRTRFHQETFRKTNLTFHLVHDVLVQPTVSRPTRYALWTILVRHPTSSRPAPSRNYKGFVQYDQRMDLPVTTSTTGKTRACRDDQPRHNGSLLAVNWDYRAKFLPHLSF